MNFKQLQKMEKIGELSKSIQKLKGYLARDDWNFVRHPWAYTGRYDDGDVDEFCRLRFFEGKDMRILFREQWQRYIDEKTDQILKLQKELADENQSS